MLADNISFWISLVLTLIIFSYLLGDNALYRLAVSFFVGLAAAFTTVVTVQSVLLPLLTDGNNLTLILLIVAGVLTLLLLLKPIKQLRVLTNIALGFLIAVGTAAAVAGAVTGTLIPLVTDSAQVDVSAGVFPLVNSIILVVGVVTSLLYFNYSARTTETGEVKRGRVMSVIAPIGQAFIIITLGALYGAAILTSLTILTGQLALLFGA